MEQARIRQMSTCALLWPKRRDVGVLWLSIGRPGPPKRIDIFVRTTTNFLGGAIREPYRSHSMIASDIDRFQWKSLAKDTVYFVTNGPSAGCWSTLPFDTPFCWHEPSIDVLIVTPQARILIPDELGCVWLSLIRSSDTLVGNLACLLRRFDQNKPPLLTDGAGFYPQISSFFRAVKYLTFFSGTFYSRWGVTVIPRLHRCDLLGISFSDCMTRGRQGISTAVMHW